MHMNPGMDPMASSPYARETALPEIGGPGMGEPGMGLAQDRSIKVALAPLRGIDALARDWNDLEVRADGSVFLSWLWVATWLKHWPAGERPHVLTARRDGQVVGLALLCPRLAWGFPAIPKRRWVLQGADQRFPNHSAALADAILADRRCANAVLAACVGWLCGQLGPRDELLLAGVGADAEPTALGAAAVHGSRAVIRWAAQAHWVDLDRVRRRGGDGLAGFLAGLGPNTRSSVRRSLRLYERHGPLSYRVAGSVEEGLEDFRTLEVLRRAASMVRGHPADFFNQRRAPFLRALIADGLDSGAVRLCRVSAGNRPVGVLCNLVHRNRTVTFQSGFAFEDDNRCKPGLVSHTLAIADALDRGEDRYAFPALPSGSRPRLSNAVQPLRWIALQPQPFGQRVETAVQRARAQAAGVCGPSDGLRDEAVRIQR